MGFCVWVFFVCLFVFVFVFVLFVNILASKEYTFSRRVFVAFVSYQSIIEANLSSNTDPFINIKFVLQGKKEIFYLTKHSTHCIYRYMASDIW